MRSYISDLVCPYCGKESGFVLSDVHINSIVDGLRIDEDGLFISDFYDDIDDRITCQHIEIDKNHHNHDNPFKVICNECDTEFQGILDNNVLRNYYNT